MLCLLVGLVQRSIYHIRTDLLTLDAILLDDLLCTIMGLLVAMIPYRHVGSSLGKCLSNRQTDPTI